MYKTLLKPLLFCLDAETAHLFSFHILRIVLRIKWIQKAVAARFPQQQKPVQLWDISFPNPVGLAAGFDKDAVIGTAWKSFGFGFVEIGTITPRPQNGNPRKRLFRLPEDEAIINRMGFNNQGVEAAVTRLQQMDKSGIILGANIGKNKDTPNEKAAEDYQLCFQRLFPYVDYFVVNVSSPNTPGLRELQEKEPLTALLLTLQQLNERNPHPKPILLKIAPDLTDSQLDDIIEVVQAAKIQGVVATNTTLSRTGLVSPAPTVAAIGNGGLSGKPLTRRSTEVVRYLHENSRGAFPIIAVGGIFSAADAQEKFQAGASLIQLYTGFVYRGPDLVKEILAATK